MSDGPEVPRTLGSVVNDDLAGHWGQIVSFQGQSTAFAEWMEGQTERPSLFEVLVWLSDHGFFL